LIVDTSALVAVVRGEKGNERILAALLEDEGLIPTPVLVEFERVTALEGNAPDPDARELLRLLFNGRLAPAPFSAADALIAADANARHGSGNARGGKLNLLDLMVYAVAVRTDRPILCTGKDFGSTGIELHPATRTGAG